MSIQIELLLSHALFFALPIGVTLGALRQWVSGVVRNRKLPCPSLLPMRRALSILAVVGALGQILFVLLTPRIGASMARLVGLIATGMVVAVVASRMIAYLPTLRAALHGVLAALPMQRAYLFLSASHEWLARVTMALLLVMLIALAVTFPLPEMPEPRKRIASGIAGRDSCVSGNVTYLRYRPRTVSGHAPRHGLRRWWGRRGR
jgi:hypothetical protein